MDKEILKQLYKPIFIHEYSDEYFDSLIEIIETSCIEKSFDWFIKCIKCFALGESDEEFRLTMANFLHSVDDTIPLEMISKNEAELLVFAQAIVYECIMISSDQMRASALSLALNTMTFGIEKSLNKFYVAEMKSFYRVNSKKNIQETRKPVNEENIKDSFNFINTENKVLKWILNLDRKKNLVLNDEQFVWNLGKELAEKSGTMAIFNYPEAYIAKILNSTSVKNIYSKEIDIQRVFEKLIANDENASIDNVLFPVMSRTFKYELEISLIDFAIEVYYEQMLLNHLNAIDYGKQ